MYYAAMFGEMVNKWRWQARIVLKKLCKQMLRKDLISIKKKKLISHKKRVMEKKNISTKYSFHPIRHHTGPADWRNIVWLFSGKDRRVSCISRVEQWNIVIILFVLCFHIGSND